MTKKLFLLLSILNSVIMAQGKANPNLDTLDIVPYKAICRFLDTQDLERLRLVSKKNKAKAEQLRSSYITDLAAQMNTLKPTLKYEDITWLSGKLEYKGKVHPLLRKALTDKINDSGFLFVIRNSGLSSLLEEAFKRTDQFPIEQAAPLYKALFNCDFPEEDQVTAIEHLKAGIPVEFYSYEMTLNEAVSKALCDELTSRRADQPYFSFGHPQADVEELKTKPHHIVVTQDQLLHPDHREILEGILENNHPHTLVLTVCPNAKGTLNLKAENLPTYVGRLLVVDNDGLCTKIGKGFLNGCPGLTAFDSRGFTKVTRIGDSFLIGCQGLTAFDSSGFTNVTIIGSRFLIDCPKLDKSSDHLKKEILNRGARGAGTKSAQ